MSENSPVELVIEELYSTEDTSVVVWKWRPTGGAK